MTSDTMTTNTLNTETTPATTEEPKTETPPVPDDDLDFADEKLGTRQESATRVIVCEGGCE